MHNCVDGISQLLEVNPISQTEARKSPEWLTRSVMYQIFLRTFTPEGTLQAALKKIPLLRELGVDIVYLCPVFLQDDDTRREFWSKRQIKFNNPHNPYRTKDYYKVDPEYGTEEDLREFVEVAHMHRIRVVLDIVYLHCGPGAVFLKDNPDYVKRGAENQVATTHWNFPALDFSNPGLREYLLKNLEFWVRDFGIDGYRCDASDQVPLDFWEQARVQLSKLNRETIILAEGQRREDQVVAFDLNYCFNWTYGIHKIFNLGTSASIVRQIWEFMAAERPQGARFMRYIDNHDIAHDTAHGIFQEKGCSDESWRGIIDFYGIPHSGLKPDCRLDKAWGSSAVDALLALCFAMDGVPLLYNGQEIADVAPHSIYGKVSVDWSKSSTAEGQRRFSYCQYLCNLRHRERTLSDGRLTWLDNPAPDRLVSFTRENCAEQTLVLVNLSSQEIQVALPILQDSSFASLLTKDVEVAGYKAVLQSYGVFIGKRSLTPTEARINVSSLNR